MIPDSLTVVGGGAIAFLILKEVFSFIKSIMTRNDNSNGKTKIDLHDIKSIIDQVKEDLDGVKAQTKDLWVWHEKEEPGEPGVKVWYGNRKRTEDALVKIAESLDRLTDLTRQMREDIKDLRIAAKKRPTKTRTRKKKS